MQLSLRKKEILKVVIDSFITDGEPVGSKQVMEQLKKPCSSATIRNEMNELDRMGLLLQPHTSAGRVPTARGYRVYVDSLMEEEQISFEETLLFHSLLSDKSRDAEQILADMTSLLSRMTSYAVVAFAKQRMGTIERFEGVFINRRSFLLVVITSSGRAVSKQLQMEIATSPESVRFIIDVLNDHLAKKELGGVTLERMAALEKELGEYRSLIGPLIQIIYDIMAEIGKENVLVRGISNLLSFPEFQGERALPLIRELEDEKALLSRFSQEYTSGLRVHIGTEREGLDGASFVVCPFRLGKDLSGAVWIIGPKRMHYAKAMAKLEYLSRQINAVHGFEPNLPLIETKEN